MYDILKDKFVSYQYWDMRYGHLVVTSKHRNHTKYAFQRRCQSTEWKNHENFQKFESDRQNSFVQRKNPFFIMIVSFPSLVKLIFIKQSDFFQQNTLHSWFWSSLLNLFWLTLKSSFSGKLATHTAFVSIKILIYVICF